MLVWDQGHRRVVAPILSCTEGVQVAITVQCAVVGEYLADKVKDRRQVLTNECVDLLLLAFVKDAALMVEDLAYVLQ